MLYAWTALFESRTSPMERRIAMDNNEAFSHSYSGKLPYNGSCKMYGWMLVILLSVGAPVAWGHGEEDTPQGAPPKAWRGKLSRYAMHGTEGVQSAMALFHSFWFEPAKKSFAKVLDHDPNAAWHTGVLRSCRWGTFRLAAQSQRAEAAAAAVVEAQRVSAKSQRERDYIAALGPFFKDWETTEYSPGLWPSRRLWKV